MQIVSTIVSKVIVTFFFYVLQQRIKQSELNFSL